MPDPRQEVRVHLSPATAFEVGSTAIPGVEIVEGEVYESDAQSLAVWTSLLRSRFGFDYRPDVAVLYIPRDHISRLEERRLAPAKTVLAIGAGAVVVVTIFELARAVGGGGSLLGEGDGADASVVRFLPRAVRFGTR